MFDNIEKFKHESNLLYNDGEFYIDEIEISRYGEVIKIENGFYHHSSLVRYLFQNHMIQKERIRYFIKARKFLKPSTFQGFFQYIFKMFDEKTAKRLANSFIGELGKNIIVKTMDSCVPIFKWFKLVGQNVSNRIDIYPSMYM